jgi:hypothetical protein
MQSVQRDPSLPLRMTATALRACPGAMRWMTARGLIITLLLLSDVILAEKVQESLKMKYKFIKIACSYVLPVVQ